MIALTVSSSRLNASPKTSLPKSSSSEAMQPASPWIRAMPSPISTTVPTSADSACPSNPLIWALMMSVISEAVDAISPPLIPSQTLTERVQPRAHRRVDEVITELDLRATDERVVDGEGRLELVTGGLLEPVHERALLAIVQRDRGRDLRLHDPGAKVDEIAIRARDVGEQRDGVPRREREQQRSDRLWLAVGGRFDGREPLLHRHA